jgi:hypothetical protein
MHRTGALPPGPPRGDRARGGQGRHPADRGGPGAPGSLDPLLLGALAQILVALLELGEEILRGYFGSGQLGQLTFRIGAEFRNRDDDPQGIAKIQKDGFDILLHGIGSFSQTGREMADAILQFLPVMHYFLHMQIMQHYLSILQVFLQKV